MRFAWAIAFFLAVTIWLISLSHEHEFVQEPCDSLLWYDTTAEMRTIVTCGRGQ